MLDAATAQQPDNPPGWITAALAGDWDTHDLATRARNLRRRQRDHAIRHAERQRADDAAARHTQTQHRRSQAWADLAADILDDDQLARLLDHVHDPRFPRSNRSVRLTTAQVTGWVAAACHLRPDLEPGRAIAAALTSPARLDTPDRLPPPPQAHTPPLPLHRRLAPLLPLLNEGRAGRPSLANGVVEAA